MYHDTTSSRVSIKAKLCRICDWHSSGCAYDRRHHFDFPYRSLIITHTFFFRIYISSWLAPSHVPYGNNASFLETSLHYYDPNPNPNPNASCRLYRFQYQGRYLLSQSGCGTIYQNVASIRPAILRTHCNHRICQPKCTWYDCVRSVSGQQRVLFFFHHLAITLLSHFMAPVRTRLSTKVATWLRCFSLILQMMRLLRISKFGRTDFSDHVAAKKNVHAAKLFMIFYFWYIVVCCLNNW